jgi:hypothetical protein
MRLLQGAMQNHHVSSGSRVNDVALRHDFVTSGGSYGPRAPAAQKVAGAELGVSK